MQQDGTGRILPQRLFRTGHGGAALRQLSLTIEALRRKLRQPASSAVMIRSRAARVEKFMGLREPFTILRNVRATTSPIAP